MMNRNMLLETLDTMQSYAEDMSKQSGKKINPFKTEAKAIEECKRIISLLDSCVYHIQSFEDEEDICRKVLKNLGFNKDEIDYYYSM